MWIVLSILIKQNCHHLTSILAVDFNGCKKGKKQKKSTQNSHTQRI